MLPWNQERLARLQAVEARIAAVREQLPDALEGRGALQWRVNALQELAARAEASRTQALAVARALAGPAPLLAELEVQVRERGLVASGRPTPGTGLPQLRQALAPAFALRQMEPTAGGLRLELVPAAAPPPAADGAAR